MKRFSKKSEIVISALIATFIMQTTVRASTKDNSNDICIGNLGHNSVNVSGNVTKNVQIKTEKPNNIIKESINLNKDGTLTFKYYNSNAKYVYLSYDMINKHNEKRAMIKNKDNVWEITLRLSDEKKDYLYNFIVDGEVILDPSNLNKEKDNEGNIRSKYSFKGFNGRKITLPGSIQGAIGESNWDPTDKQGKSTFGYDGNGNYKLILKNVPAGNYEYKIAMGNWNENYGLNGINDGSNIKINNPKVQDIVFWYNDDSHRVINSLTYKDKEIYLKGDKLPQNIKLLDSEYSGIYSAVINLEKGNYTNMKIVFDNKEIPINNICIKDNIKRVKITFDPTTGMSFNNLSNKELNKNEIYFNSRDIKYKNKFGAVKKDESVIFSIKTLKDDVSEVKMIVEDYNKQKKILELKKLGKFDENHDKWTVNTKFTNIGIYKYYFIISNGSKTVAYCDDGLLGEGKVSEVHNILPYEVNVFSKDFKTPDWMKNAIVYQIFPDRFLNGNKNNDKSRLDSRGNTMYEFYEDWYAIPENPNLEFNEEGSVKKDYKGTKGDGIFCNEIYGGDLIGIRKKLDYLKALGVNTLYLNPIASSISNHRYDTTDYKEIDSILGNIEDFKELSKEAKKRNMHIILDGVFNHVSDDSVYFDRYGKYIKSGKPIGAYVYWSKIYDKMNLEKISQKQAEIEVINELKNQGITDIHYKDWFKVSNNKIKPGTKDEHYEYEGWAGYDSMPVIKSPKGSEYNIKTWADEIIDGKDSIARYWLKQGSNGWRLDVANEVSDETWRKFRNAVKAEGDNVIIGEIWNDSSKYLLGDMYDSVMNYRFRNCVLGFLRDGKSAKEIQNELEYIREQYPKEAFDVMLNLVDSHDTERILCSLDGMVKDKNDNVIPLKVSEKAKKLQRLVPYIQMTYPGAPCIYYGDEMAMLGAKDPDDRRGMNWGKGDKQAVEVYATLSNIRNIYEVLRNGNVKNIESNNDDILCYERYNITDKSLVVINRGEKFEKIELNLSDFKDGEIMYDAITGEKYEIKGGKINLKINPMSGIVFVNEYKKFKLNNINLKEAYDPQFVVNNHDDEVNNNISINKFLNIKEILRSIIDVISGMI
ncbi:alpha-amylase family glycosyl hydrolase [Clostridium botulinum]|uniref:alpha-amylase family glycosyl hydrolase n=1 Tax=Clostridium botulinum TaxID=1491 RepID=UPI001E38810C|nr:alpha-amylase family glycosyl hydrolase [Clostridium botulinum]MCD3202688.1 alpha amylase [Clostridium botulinum C/D]MCD3222488.1 alpha amylase [Clostridium botulinum C/D]MCD3230713.1 alpha amylase [Clostridium botulinum C/D]MCD3273261.1 alpha amylase [Clostridium botulinum C/D]MCD3297565.1 alpha amylase [Clostridium botulinum C/D]